LGRFEDILQAMEPLSECHHDTVTYQVITDRFDILRHPKKSSSWSLLFHRDNEGIVRVYFGITNAYAVTLKREQRLNAPVLKVFSGENLFNYLQITFPIIQGDPIQDLSALSQVIQANFSRINSAFCDKNIQTTSLELSKTEQGTLEDIKKAFVDASGLE
jgi:hypothetical protein